VRYLEDPRQSSLFDVFADILSTVAYSKLRSGWQHLFRSAILKRMPAEKLANHFHPVMGRPTKELYSMAGLLFIMEFRDWTHEEAADAYMFSVDVQYALNLKPEQQSLCRRTIERYISLFREDELAQGIMHDVTAELVTLLELDVSQQRLDSTHIESNMAKFGRIRLMSTAIRRFLTQLKRHDEGSYSQLRPSIRERYEASPNSVFGWKKLSDDEVNTLRQSVAEDLAYLVDQYRRNKNHNSRSTYLMMVKVFEQQCQVEGDRVRVREKTGGNIVCNPSDPDATLDGHKGSGYQVQLSETCSPDNATQLILSALPETACQSDSAALKDVVEDLKERGVLPSQMLADTAYGSDENHCHCRDEGIDLISPTAGKCPENQIDPQMLTAVDFRVEMGTNIRANGLVETCPQCVACPAGTIPHRSHYDRDTGQITVLQLPETCRACSLDARCPRKRESAFYAVAINPKQVRLIERRRHEQTDDFKDKYRVRSGIESTNSLLKRGTGLGRLRVRGRKAVFMSILLKVAGWNVMRAAKAMGKAAKSALSRRIVSSIQPRPTILRSNSKFLAI
jgi:Transposase DDE domain